MDSLMLFYAALALNLHLIGVHGPDNQAIDLNASEISSLREQREAEEGHFGPNVKCVVFMTNGKFIGTRESCYDIIRHIKELK